MKIRASWLKILAEIAQSGQIPLGFADQWIELEHDSRRFKPGQVFLALKGKNFDGHDFLNDVLAHRPTAIIVSREMPQTPGTWVIKVQDTLQALKRLARLKLQASNYQVRVAITGSNGKTSTKEFLRQILESLGNRCFGNPGSYNNDFGVCFSLLSAPDDVPFFIQELGMNHAGEITASSHLFSPTHVVCTMVGTAHIENFDNQHQLALAKFEIYEANPLSVAFFNWDNAWTRQMWHWDNRKIKIRVSTLDESADCYMRVIETHWDHFVVEGHLFGQVGRARVALPGSHHVNNVLLSASIAAYLLPEQRKDVWQVLEKLKPFWGRTQMIKTATFDVLFDAYNANPESFAALFELVAKSPHNYRLGLIGDMKELGSLGAEAHEQLGSLAARLASTEFIYVGEFGKEFEKGFGSSQRILGIFQTYESRVAELVRMKMAKGGLLFVKASRSVKLEQALQDLGILK